MLPKIKLKISKYIRILIFFRYFATLGLGEIKMKVEIFWLQNLQPEQGATASCTTGVTPRSTRCACSHRIYVLLFAENRWYRVLVDVSGQVCSKFPRYLNRAIIKNYFVSATWYELTCVAGESCPAQRTGSCTPSSAIEGPPDSFRIANAARPCTSQR